MDRGGRDALRACPSAVSAGRTGPQDRRPLWLTPSAMSAGRTEAQDRRPLWLAPGRDPRPNGAPTPPPGNTSARPKPRPRERRGREIRYRADSVWLSLDSTHNLYAVLRFPRPRPPAEPRPNAPPRKHFRKAKNRGPANKAAGKHAADLIPDGCPWIPPIIYMLFPDCGPGSHEPVYCGDQGPGPLLPAAQFSLRQDGSPIGRKEASSWTRASHAS